MDDQSDSPIIVVGLGNPGSEYMKTRHNIGFMVVETLRAQFKCVWRPGQGDYLISRAETSGKSAVFVKPLTYMNNSGEAVRDVLERFLVPISNLIVVVDDFAFELGTIRVRSKGSDGGHNGLRSIIYELNTDEFARIRCGIKKPTKPAKSEMADFVLSPFDDDEREAVTEMIGTATEAVKEFVRSGIGRTMTKFNAQK